MSGLRVFALQDIKLGAFIMIFAAANEGAAQRTVSDMVQAPNHPFNKHAEDYNLFEVGTFDEVSGAIADTGIRSVCNLVSLK